jgi:hypothetical protein
MTKAKRVHSTPRKTAPKIKPKLSAVSRIDKSGFDLVPTRKMTGKRATIKDCAKINFKPWRRTAEMQPTELMPSAEVVNANGVNCRLAYGVMLETRAQLLAMHGNLDHAHIDKLMAGLSKLPNG